MSDILTIESGETYSIIGGKTEEWLRTEVDGTLDLSDGQIRLIDDPDASSRAGPTQGNAEGGNDLYDSLVQPDNLYRSLVQSSDMQEGFAIIVLGLIALFGFVTVKFRSLIVGLAWMFSITTFVLAILVDFSMVYFWLTVALCSVTTVIALAEGVLT